MTESVRAEMLWVVLPYLAFVVFVAGHAVRYATDPYGWSSHSSQILERRILSWASPLFHYGAIAAILGHAAGILVPMGVYAALGIGSEQYHVVSVGAGGLAGAAVLAGLIGLLWRRLTVRRVRAVSLFGDWLVLGMLIVVAGLGWSCTVLHTLVGGPYEYRLTIGPWFRGLFLLHPRPELWASVPLIFRVHVVSSLLFFIVWPFTRLVHVWSLPLPYLSRATILYRKRGAPGGRFLRRPPRRQVPLPPLTGAPADLAAGTRPGGRP